MKDDRPLHDKVVGFDRPCDTLQAHRVDIIENFELVPRGELDWHKHALRQRERKQRFAGVAVFLGFLVFLPGIVGILIVGIATLQVEFVWAALVAFVGVLVMYRLASAEARIILDFRRVTDIAHLPRWVGVMLNVISLLAIIALTQIDRIIAWFG